MSAARVFLRYRQIAVDSGILAPTHEVREVEGWNRIEGGDALRQPAAPARGVGA